MLPIPLLVAMIVAFGIDPPRANVPASDVGFRLFETCGGISVVAILSVRARALGASQVCHGAMPATRVRRRHARGVQLLTLIALVVYGWIIHSVGWGRLVRINWGLGNLGLINDAIVFAPFLRDPAAGLVGPVPGRSARSRPGHRPVGLRAAGPIPGAAVPPIDRPDDARDPPVLHPAGRPRTAAGRAGSRMRWPSPIEIAMLGTLVLLAAPLFIRFAWPTRSAAGWPLAPPPQRVADRAGFRFADVRVWDTGN